MSLLFYADPLFASQIIKQKTVSQLSAVYFLILLSLAESGWKNILIYIPSVMSD